MDQGLKITVSADVRKAILELTDLTDATGELAVEGVGNITSINQALQSLRNAQKDAGDPAQLQVINRALKDLGAEAARLRKAGVDGFDEFGNKAKAASGNVLGFANTAFGALRKIAYVLPGIGVAGLIGGIADAVVDFFRSSSKEAEEAAKFNKLYFSTFQVKAPLDIVQAQADLKGYQKIVEDSVSNSSKEAAQVDILVGRLKEGNTTRSQTVDIIKKLQSIAPEYFSKLDAEKASVNDVTEAYTNYNKALVASIEAQIHISEITDLVKKRLDFSRQAPEAAKFVNDLLAQGKSLDDISKSVTDDFLAQNKAAGQAYLANKANVSELEKQAQAASKIPFGVSTVIDYLRREQDLLKSISNVPLGQIGVDGSKTNKTVDDLLEKIKRAQETLNKPDTRPIFKRFADSIADDRVNGVALLQKQIGEAIAEGAAIGTRESKDAASLLASLYQQEINRIKFPDRPAHVDFTLANPASQVEKLESAIEKTFGKNIKLTVPIDVKARIESSGFDSKDERTLLEKVEKDTINGLPTIRWTPKIQAIVDSKTIADQTLVELNKAATTILQGIAASGLEDIGVALGDALSGDGFSKAIGDFKRTLGEGLVEVGKQLIVTSTIIKSIRVALDNLFENPIVGIAVGIGAIAIGEALINSVSKTGAHAFATGGIVTGPTLGLVGEAGPEVIFPLSQLNRFIQGTQGRGDQNINVRGQISGNNIRLALARSNKQQGLV
jgi:hypothetical protein